MSGIDLHTHSFISLDGEYPPARLMELCSQAGLRAAALADHNSVRGVAEARDRAHRLRLPFLCAVELDCTFEGLDLHLLGYGIDPACGDFAQNEENILAQKRETSRKRMAMLKELGVYFDRGAVMALSRDGVVTGEMVAQAALQDERNRGGALMAPYFPGGARSDNPYVNFFWDFCAQGKPAFIPVRYPTLQQAVSLITGSGGVAVLAHPGNTVGRDKDKIEGIFNCGVRGLEAFSSYHTREDARFYCSLAREHGKGVTCGSDFHGKTKPAVALGSVDCMGLEEEILSFLA